MCAPTHLRVHVVHVPAISCSHMVASHIHLGMEPWVAAAVLWGPPSGLLTLPVRLEYAMLPATVARTLLPVLALFHTSGVETAYVPARPCTRHMCVHFCIPCLHAPGGGRNISRLGDCQQDFQKGVHPFSPAPPFLASPGRLPHPCTLAQALQGGRKNPHCQTTGMPHPAASPTCGITCCSTAILLFIYHSLSVSPSGLCLNSLTCSSCICSGLSCYVSPHAALGGTPSSFPGCGLWVSFA